MLTIGNTKLGNILNWSLPAIETCPGSTTLCRGGCYACRGAYRFHSTQAAHARNLLETYKKTFVSSMTRAVKRAHTTLVRIHASGDFYNVAYTQAWREIINNCPDTQFFAYTRSWRRTPEAPARLRMEIYKLSRLPNMRVWLSCDAETGRPPRWRRAPHAYMSLHDEDYPDYPVELVFRDKPVTTLRRLGPHQSLICPYEQGWENKNIKCDACGICFDDRRKVLKLHAIQFSGKVDKACV